MADGAIVNKIYIGSLTDPDWYFENDNIFSANVVQNVALVGQELSIDTFTVVVADEYQNVTSAYLFRSSDGKVIETALGEIYAIDVQEDNQVSDLIELPYGTPVWYYQDDILIGKFYTETVKRVGRNQYEISTVSAIGMLDNVYHGGGLFASTTFGAVLAHILASGLHGTGDPIIHYVIDDEVRDLPCSCWLPYDTKRNNLYQIVFANGVNIIKNLAPDPDLNGCPRFTFLYTAPTDAAPIDDEAIYNEGNVEYKKPYTKISVLEHTYTDVYGADSVVLFDNTVGESAADKEIWFTNAPVIVDSLYAEGSLFIVDGTATVNSVKVSGNGKLYGVPYLHTTKTISDGDSSAEDKNTISVTNCTAVNVINSENLLARLKAYFIREKYIERISNGILYSGERCGKAYQLLNPFSEDKTAFLSSMNITVSAVNKANCEWDVGYVPVGQAGLFDKVNVKIPEPDPQDPETLVYEGDWTVPAGVTKFKVVMVGGGTGGFSGYPGENGDDTWTHTEIATTDDLSASWYGAEGGNGGDGGAGGQPGRVKVVVVEDAVPGTVYHWTLGTGGEGGEATGYIPDTVDELRSALRAENPDGSWTDAELLEMIEEYENTGWDGNPNAGVAGTASTFGITGGTIWSTADADASVPTGGVYDPLNENYYALTGKPGIRGGKGGARKESSGGTFTWVTTGEDVKGDPDANGNKPIYHGGNTGTLLTVVNGLPEAKIKAYGGNGAGAAVGIDRGNPEYTHINGASDQTTSWYVEEDDD